MKHVRGAPLHPLTQDKIERWRQTLKNRILLENHVFEGELEAAIATFIDQYNNRRYHESIGTQMPADACFGRSQTILTERWRIKQKTIQNRRLNHKPQAAQPEPDTLASSASKSVRLLQIIGRRTDATWPDNQMCDQPPGWGFCKKLRFGYEEATGTASIGAFVVVANVSEGQGPAWVCHYPGVTGAWPENQLEPLPTGSCEVSGATAQK